MTYVRPRPVPCAACGLAVVHEDGVFDAGMYAKGYLERHYCPVPSITPLNESDFKDPAPDLKAFLGAVNINWIEEEAPASPPPASRGRKPLEGRGIGLP